MSLSEFDIIRKYFTNIGYRRDDVQLGVGDDCALLRPEPGFDMVVTVDNMVLDVHFDAMTPVDCLAYKSVMVSVSDIAAMGARPAWLTLALTLPEADEKWLQLFSKGLHEVCQETQISLVGGNLSRGSLNIATQLTGLVRPDSVLLRSGASAGQGIFVTGNLGDAGMGLLSHQQRLNELDLDPLAKSQVRARFYRPTARVDIGFALHSMATSCIDISDGFVADLQHLLNASEVGATIELTNLPVHPIFHRVFEQVGQWRHPISAGEDYELCFTASMQYIPQIQQLSKSQGVSITQVGIVELQSGLRLTLDGSRYVAKMSDNEINGFQHF
ncbi:MAG: thiamine-phosphate kinase [Thiohalomonadales bacterium]